MIIAFGSNDYRTEVEIEMASDLKDYGYYGEDGQRYIGEVFYLVITNKNGDRWQFGKWNGAVEEYDDSNNRWFIDVRQQVRAFAEKMKHKIIEKGEVQLTYWETTHPAYGSNAYVQYGQAEQVQQEKNQE